MSARSRGVQAVALLLATALCGCSAVGLGYRANQARGGSGRAEAERLSKLAQLYEKQGHPAGAMRLYRQALHSDPRAPEARERLMALSTQHAAVPQAPSGAAPLPTPIAVESPLLAQGTVTPAAVPSAVTATPVRSGPAPSAGTPALAPEPPTTPIRATPRPLNVVDQPAGPVSDPHAGSVVAESASAVAAAAAPILALMSPARSPSQAVPNGSAEPARLPAPIEEPKAEAADEGAVVELTKPVPEAVVATEPAATPMDEAPTLLDASISASEAGPVEVEAAPVSREVVPAPLPLPTAEHIPAPLEIETSAKVAIVTLPPATPPIDVPSQQSSGDWSTSRVTSASSIPAPPRQTVAVQKPDYAGIAIRPQNPTSDEVGRAVLNPTAWSRTDLVRLCPDASAELLAVVRRLESSEASVRKDALIELAQLAGDARPVLGAARSLCHDTDQTVQAHAAWAMFRISESTEESVAVLSAVVQSKNPAAATFAAYCLGLLETQAAGAVPALQLACGSEVGEVRLCAAEALLRITPEAAEPVAVLIDGLRDPAPEHRWLAAISLSAASNTYQESAVIALIPLLNDAEADVCSSAALALGAFGPGAAEASPELSAATSHADADVRDAATAALECIAE